MGKRKSGLAYFPYVTCPHCGAEDVQGRPEDTGIGPYEFWGRKGYDSHTTYFCPECDEELEGYEVEESEPEYEPEED